MHSKTNTPVKELTELDNNMSLVIERQTSFLEEDLALSSSTHDSIIEKTVTEASEKTHDEMTGHSLTGSESDQQQQPTQSVIYVSEDAMDCNYDEEPALPPPAPNLDRTSEQQQPLVQAMSFIETQVIIEEDPPSPELFESDADDEAESTNTTSTYPTTIEDRGISPPSPSKKLSSAELIFRADKFLQRRINKYLRGVPPPPNHTISQRDCDDFLVYIRQNRQYFWADPFELDKKASESDMSSSLQESTEEQNEDTISTSTISTNKVFHQSKTGLRNLSTAFDACEQSSLSKIDNNDSLLVDELLSDTTSSFTLSETLFNNCSILSTSTIAPLDETKLCDDYDKQTLPTLYTSIKTEEAAVLPWPDAFGHRCHEIYYNRNKSLEDFENLRMKLCDRYIGAETQSTCNVWFAKQMPMSARKRSLLAKRNMGQSPGKRLSYLARRRKTFSSANLQGLGLAEKKQLFLNVKKGLTRKGKSPRGKTPRGKSPRGKTPRSSAKKRRRLVLEGPTPRKTKNEIAKRALFQSPPIDRPGPSRTTVTAAAPAATVTNNHPQKFKRALFPTPKKSEADDSSQAVTLSHPESKKRKSEDDLENPKQKWAKSLSFDCTRNLDNSSSNGRTLVRHSTGSALARDGNPNYAKCELSDTHRKKLLWAVAEALRGRGIGMNHPMFKQYASNLARTVRKFMPDLDNKNIPRKPGSTSDRMLKLAKRHVLLIVEGKTTL